MSRPILLRGGTLIDGSGAPGLKGDVLLAGDRIAATGAVPLPQDARVVDCAGMAVVPGFIDAHSHSDLQVLADRPEKIAQGVTAEVVGNCGFSPYPVTNHSEAVHEFANGIFCGDQSWGWRSAREYLADVEQKSRTATVHSLIGHGTLRIAVAGPKLGPLNEQELAGAEGLLREALEQGAAGFSTGLMYAPGSSAPFEELVRLCRVVARYGKIYCSHIRSYSFGLEEAVEEQLELARQTGCRLQISHLQTVGRMNWPKQRRVVERIERAREQGIDVAFDCYPYVAGSTVLTQLLPQAALDGGTPALLRRLRDPAARDEIAVETQNGLPHRWEDIVISAVRTEANSRLIGLDLAAAAQERGEEPLETLLNLLEEEHGEVNMISFNQSEENLRETLTHPLSIIISDGFYVRGRPHPRLYGTFPRLLGAIARERNWMPLETAVHKVTGKPAERFGFKRRGLLRPEFAADISVFDPALVDSPATWENPQASPVGIAHVFRNGVRLAGNADFTLTE